MSGDLSVKKAGAPQEVAGANSTPNPSEAPDPKKIKVLPDGQNFDNTDGLAVERGTEPEMTDAEFEQRAQALQERINNLENRSAIQELKTEISDAIEEEIDEAIDTAQRGAKAVADGAEAAVDWVADTGTKAWHQTKETATDIGNAIADGAEVAADWVVDTGTKAWDKTKETATDVGNAIADGAEVAADWVVDTGTKAWNETKETATDVGNAIADGAEVAADWVVDTGTKAWNKTKETATDVGNAIADGAEAVADGAVAGYKAVKQGVKNVHNAQVEFAEDVAKTVGNKAKKGVKGFFKSLRAEVKAKPAAPDPTKMTKEQYLQAQEARVQALENESLTDRIENEIKEGWNEALDSAEKGAAKVYSGAKKAAKTVLNWFKGNKIKQRHTTLQAGTYN